MVAKGSKVLAWSPNVFRNHSQIDYSGASFHAEEAALRELCRATGKTYGQGAFKGLTIYVARVNTVNEPRLSRPCGSCLDHLTYQGIFDIVYTNELGGLSHETIEQ